jgi:hypothetical protein
MRMTEREAYLENDDASKARLLAMIDKGKALKVQLAALEKELSLRFQSMKALADAYQSDLGDTVFHVGSTEFEIQRPYPRGQYAASNRPPLNTLARLDRKHFDGESLAGLLTARDGTRRRLKDTTETLREAGYTI